MKFLELLRMSGAFDTGGEVVIHGLCGDMACVDMKDGILTVYGNCHRPCGNMKGGTAIIYGTAYAMPPAFSNEGGEIYDSKKFTRFRGDVANRGKGVLRVAKYEYY